MGIDNRTNLLANLARIRQATDAYQAQPLPGFEVPEVYQPQLEYFVPVDPASLNDCDACQ